MSRLRVWDLPTRLFHWALVLLIAFAWISAEQRWMQWHRLGGYALLALLLFRIAWGFAGSSTARFAQFLRGPRALRAYLRRELPAPPGHNPLGGWNVLAMLTLLLLQVLLGLFAVDIDGLDSGPLSRWIGFDAGRQAAELHGLVFNGLLGLIALHLAALLYHRLRKGERLVAAMLSGEREWTGDAPGLRFVSPGRALLLLALSAAAVSLLVLLPAG